jgi:hypothetical protein
VAAVPLAAVAAAWQCGGGRDSQAVQVRLKKLDARVKTAIYGTHTMRKGRACGLSSRGDGGALMLPPSRRPLVPQ